MTLFVSSYEFKAALKQLVLQYFICMNEFRWFVLKRFFPWLDELLSEYKLKYNF